MFFYYFLNFIFFFLFVGVSGLLKSGSIAVVVCSVLFVTGGAVFAVSGVIYVGAAENSLSNISLFELNHFCQFWLSFLNLLHSVSVSSYN